MLSYTRKKPEQFIMFLHEEHNAALRLTSLFRVRNSTYDVSQQVLKWIEEKTNIEPGHIEFYFTIDDLASIDDECKLAAAKLPNDIDWKEVWFIRVFNKTSPNKSDAKLFLACGVEEFVK